MPVPRDESVVILGLRWSPSEEYLLCCWAGRLELLHHIWSFIWLTIDTRHSWPFGQWYPWCCRLDKPRPEEYSSLFARFFHFFRSESTSFGICHFYESVRGRRNLAWSALCHSGNWSENYCINSVQSWPGAQICWWNWIDLATASRSCKFRNRTDVVVNNTLLPDDPRDCREYNLIDQHGDGLKKSKLHPKRDTSTCVPSSFTMSTHVLPGLEGYSAHLSVDEVVAGPSERHNSECC